jgi:hypothetical protein
MLHTTNPVIKHKAGLLNQAKELSNASKACKIRGVLINGGAGQAMYLHVVEPRSRVLTLPRLHFRHKKARFERAFLSEYGGEGGIRTLDTLPYTHFPGVLLQPLGHLTILLSVTHLRWATGRYYRESGFFGQAEFFPAVLFG